jgi:hypothetical protein
MSNVKRIRLTRVPAPRDLEDLSLRYLRINGVYDVPTSLANDLMEMDCATSGDGELLTDLSEPLSSDRNGK